MVESKSGARPPANGSARRRSSPTTVGAVFSPDSRSLLTWDVRPGECDLLERGQLAGGPAGLALARYTPPPRRLHRARRCRLARLPGRNRSFLGPASRRGDQSERAACVTATRSPPPRLTPDGNQAVTGCQGGIVCLWNVPARTFLHDMRGNAGEVDAVAFSRDGKTVLTGSHDGTAGSGMSSQDGSSARPSSHRCRSISGVPSRRAKRGHRYEKRDRAAVARPRLAPTWERQPDSSLGQNPNGARARSSGVGPSMVGRSASHCRPRTTPRIRREKVSPAVRGPSQPIKPKRRKLEDPDERKPIPWMMSITSHRRGRWPATSGSSSGPPRDTAASH